MKSLWIENFQISRLLASTAAPSGSGTRAPRNTGRYATAYINP